VEEQQLFIMSQDMRSIYATGIMLSWPKWAMNQLFFNI